MWGCLQMRLDAGGTLWRLEGNVNDLGDWVGFPGYLDKAGLWETAESQARAFSVYQAFASVGSDTGVGYLRGLCVNELG